MDKKLNKYQTDALTALVNLYTGSQVSTDFVRLYMLHALGYDGLHGNCRPGRALSQLRDLGLAAGGSGSWTPNELGIAYLEALTALETGESIA